MQGAHLKVGAPRRDPRYGRGGAASRLRGVELRYGTWRSVRRMGGEGVRVFFPISSESPRQVRGRQDTPGAGRRSWAGERIKTAASAELGASRLSVNNHTER